MPTLPPVTTSTDPPTEKAVPCTVIVDVVVSCPVIVSPVFSTLSAAEPAMLPVTFAPVKLVRADPLPKKPEAVTDAPLMRFPLAPVAVNAAFVIPDAPVNVAPDRGAYTPTILPVDGIPVSAEPLPKNPDALTEDALVMNPPDPVSV